MIVREVLKQQFKGLIWGQSKFALTPFVRPRSL
jgi:hypothetical protein